MSSQTTAKEKETPAASRAPSRAASAPRRAVAWALGILAGLILLGMVGSLTYALVFYPDIYPHVYIDGVAVGGQSRAQVERALEEVLAPLYAGKSIALTVDEHTEIIRAEGVGAHVSAADTAQRAWETGRTGSVFSRIGTVVASLFARTDLSSSTEFHIDRKALADLLAETARLVDRAPVEYDVEILAGEIAVKNAKAGRVMPQAALLELLAARFENRDFASLYYETDKQDPAELDWNALYDSVHAPPRNAYLDTSDKNNIRIMPESPGLTFDLDAAKKAAKTDADTFVVPLVRSSAAITREMLEEALFRDELGSCTTMLSASNVPRTSNIRLAAQAIDGQILLPGEVFSYNESVGQRTAARGYQTAGAYVNGKLVPETGGGICQLSSSLYVAVVHANLKIVERINHSMVVAYLKPGLDATVNWGTTDFRFENDTRYPLRISAVQEGNAVRVTLKGTMETPFTVEIEREELSVNPAQSSTILNDALSPGARVVTVSGYTGYTVQTYRVVKDADGRVISREKEALSKYRRIDQVIEVGPPVEDVPVTPPGESPADPGVPPEPDPETPVFNPEETPHPEETPPGTQEEFPPVDIPSDSAPAEEPESALLPGLFPSGGFS